MKHLLFIVLVFLALCACSSPTPEEMASLAAKGYYEHLLKGEYDKFLEGKAGSDSLPLSALTNRVCQRGSAGFVHLRCTGNPAPKAV